MFDGQAAQFAPGVALGGMSAVALTLPDEADIRMLFDLLPHIVWLADRDGAIDYVNRRAREYVGVPAGTDWGSATDWLAVVHSEDVEKTRAAWIRVVAEQTEAELTYRIRRADGAYRWHFVRAVPIRDAAGDLLRWIGTCTDIEDQRALEAELRRVQCETAESLMLLETLQRRRQQREVEDRHDQKLESLGRLSAGLAHEINTPIQFVGDNTRFLAEAYQQMLELLLVYRDCMGADRGQQPWAERRHRVEEAEKAADIDDLASEVPSAVAQSLEGIKRVASLVKAMKAFSYKDTKDRAYADLNEAIRTTVIVARNEVKDVADVVLDLAEIPEMLCHVGDLNQVFLHLLVNAADAMDGRGQRGEIRVSTHVEDRAVVISFADNGAGISEEIQKTIFEPFFTTKEVGKGTGQGLALAVAVCEKHAGTIGVDSTLGEGSTFTLRLPIAGKGQAA